MSLCTPFFIGRQPNHTSYHITIYYKLCCWSTQHSRYMYCIVQYLCKILIALSCYSEEGLQTTVILETCWHPSLWIISTGHGFLTCALPVWRNWHYICMADALDTRHLRLGHYSEIRASSHVAVTLCGLAASFLSSLGHTKCVVPASAKWNPMYKLSLPLGINEYLANLYNCT